MLLHKKQTTKAKDKTEYFPWSDDEVKLLLSSTMDYKTSKEMENVDWESCQSNYQDIHDKFVDTNDCLKLFLIPWHTIFKWTKAIINSKWAIEEEIIVNNTGNIMLSAMLHWIYDRETLRKINHMTKWRKRIQKVPDTKSSPSTLIQKSCVFKLFHSTECIQRICAL